MKVAKNKTESILMRVVSSAAMWKEVTLVRKALP